LKPRFEENGTNSTCKEGDKCDMKYQK